MVVSFAHSLLARHIIKCLYWEHTVANDFPSQILGGVLGNAAAGQQGTSGGLGGLGDVLGGPGGAGGLGGMLGNEQVASGMAQILPHVVNHLTPAGDVPPDTDDLPGAGLAAVQKLLGQRG